MTFQGENAFRWNMKNIIIPKTAFLQTQGRIAVQMTYFNAKFNLKARILNVFLEADLKYNQVHTKLKID